MIAQILAPRTDARGPWLYTTIKEKNGPIDKKNKGGTTLLDNNRLLSFNLGYHN